MSNSVIGALRVNLGLDAAQFTRGVNQAQSRMQRFGRQMQGIGAAISVVGTGVALAVRGQINAADELAKSALRIGIPVEALSQLQHAAELSDVSLSDLQGSMQRMSRAMVEDSQSFTAVGIAVRDASGEMRPVMDVFQDVADRLAAMPEGAERTALAMDLMGRSGANMMPLMAGGAAAIREMMDEADRLGLTISGETAAAAQQFNDNILRLQRTFSGITRQISAELLPIIEGMSEHLVRASQVFQNLSPTTRRFAAAIAGITVVVGPLTIAAGLLVTVLAGLSAPVLAAIAAFTAIAAAVIALWPHFVTLKDTLVNLVDSGIDRVTTAFSDMRAGIETATANVAATVSARFEELVAYFSALPARFMEFGRSIVQGLSDGIMERWNGLRDSVTGVFDGVLDYLPEWARIRSPSRLFHEFGEFLMQGLANGITALGAAPIDAMRGVADEIAGPVQDAASEISGAFESAFVGFVTGTMSAREALASLARDMARMAAQNLFRGLFGGMFGGGGGGGGFGGFLRGLVGFDGGGYTGNAPRTGGLDGKGGFLAMMHPRETVTDHTKGGGGGQAVIRLDLSPDIEARIMSQTQGMVIQTARAQERALPGAIQQHLANPRRT
jgi:hypothetical protein